MNFTQIKMIICDIIQKYYFLKKNRNNLAMKKKLCYNFINKKSKAMKETPICRDRQEYDVTD